MYTALAAYLDVDYESFISKRIVTSSWQGMLGLVKSGAADFALGTVSSATAYEMAASPHGLRWISLDPTNGPAMERWHGAWAIPGYNIMFLPAGKGAAVAEGGLWVYGSPHSITTLATVDPELIYTLAKGISRGYEAYSGSTETAWQASLANNLDLTFTLPQIPWHEGTVRWFKEIGAWSPALEQEQAKRLKVIGASK